MQGKLRLLEEYVFHLIRCQAVDLAGIAVNKMSFSGALKLADVSDFIAPSQACIVNLNGGKPTTQNAEGLQVSPLSPPLDRQNKTFGIRVSSAKM